MFSLTVSTSFPATHAITIAGVVETPHEHDWRVVVAVAGDTLDGDGLLCDFHELERSLEAIVTRFRGRDLNSTPPFDKLVPTAEHVARYFAEQMAERVPGSVTLDRVTVTEAPGCEATYQAEKR